MTWKIIGSGSTATSAVGAHNLFGNFGGLSALSDLDVINIQMSVTGDSASVGFLNNNVGERVTPATSLIELRPMRNLLASSLLFSREEATNVTAHWVAWSKEAVNYLDSTHGFVQDGAVQTYSEKVLTYNPSLYYSFNQASGTSILDLSSNGYEGSVNAITWQADVGPDGVGNFAPFFDGINDFMTLDQTEAGADNGWEATSWDELQGTIVCWAKVNNGTAVYF